MNCKELCETVSVFLLIVLLIVAIALLLFVGVSTGKETIVENCDKVGEFKVQDYVYECKLKED